MKTAAPLRADLHCHENGCCSSGLVSPCQFYYVVVSSVVVNYVMVQVGDIVNMRNE